MVALVGPSGSGKTSLLYCLAGLVHPDAGDVRYKGIRISELDYNALAALRRKAFGFIFQFAELVSELSLAENIALSLDLNGVTRSLRNIRVGELLERFDLVEHAPKRPAQVSGGEAQRAAVARALAHRPSVVFADEPTGALDGPNGEVVLASLLAAAREEKATVVIVTHDEQIASRANRCVRMANGATLVA